jgi:hypothetical protein
MTDHATARDRLDRPQSVPSPGEVVSIAIYDSKGDADAAASTDQELVASFGEFSLKPAEVNEYGVDGYVINA